MKSFPYILIFVLIASQGSGQNLVLNQGFENYNKCPEKFTRKKLKLKQDVRSIQGTADYFNYCSNTFNPTDNPFGSQQPFEGQAHCGLIVTSEYINECASREYMQLKLREPLKAGNKYLVSIRVNLADNSGYYTDQIGMYFTEFDLSKKKRGVSEFLGRPNVKNEDNNFLKDTVSWTEIKGVYNAKGEEKFLVIGNFQECNRTSRKALTPNDSLGVMTNLKRTYLRTLNKDDSGINLEKLAYYFLDNIVVTPLPSNESIAYLTAEDACTINKPLNSISSEKNLIRDSGFNFNTDHVKAVWKSASTGTPDFFEGYTGIYLYSNAGRNNREYIIAPLKEKVSPCHEYVFSLKIKRDQSTKYSVDKIGVALIDTIYYQEDRMIFPFQPAFESPDNLLIDNTDDWIRVCGDIRLTECASYILIGNFSSDDKTYIMPSEDSSKGGPYAYYYIDDIELYQTATIQGCRLSCESETNNTVEIDSTVVEVSVFSSDTLSIKFETGGSSIDSISEFWISYFKQAITESDSLIVFVEGHTDDTGGDELNDRLSQKRALSAYELLLQAGIERDKLVYKGFGRKTPIADNTTENGRSLNRRVDIYLIDSKKTRSAGF